MKQCSSTLPTISDALLGYVSTLWTKVMVMIFASVMSLACRYYSGVGNLLWIYLVINAAAIIHAYANSMGSMNADARLIVKAGICLGIAGIFVGFALLKCLTLCMYVYRSMYVYRRYITLYRITGQHIPIDVAGLIVVELKFAAHAYDFYGRVPVQRRTNNTTPIAPLNWPVHIARLVGGPLIAVAIH